jgi:hypothetical protein
MLSAVAWDDGDDVDILLGGLGGGSVGLSTGGLVGASMLKFG